MLLENNQIHNKLIICRSLDFHRELSIEDNKDRVVKIKTKQRIKINRNRP